MRVKKSINLKTVRFGTVCVLLACLMACQGCRMPSPTERIHELAEEYAKEYADSRIINIADLLTDNVAEHRGMGEDLHQYCIDCHSAWSQSSKTVAELMDSINVIKDGTVLSPSDYKSDCETADVDDLWAYIVDSYRLLNHSRWSRSVNFQDFLDFVVPYRVNEEPLNTMWRQTLTDKYPDIFSHNSIDTILSIPKAANEAMKIWNGKPFKWTDNLPHGGLGVQGVFIKAGNCRDYSDAAVFLMRALGIPAGIDMMFAREGAQSSHYWAFILDENGKTYVSTPEIPMWYDSRLLNRPANKVYRITFAKQLPLFDGTRDSEYCLHPRFRNGHLRDVTHAYFDVANLEISMQDKSIRDDSPVYLCNAARNHWSPIAVGKSAGGKAVFSDVAACGDACIVARWDGANLISLTSPFLIDEDFKPRFFTTSDRFIEAHIYCKYPLSEKNGDVVDRVIGGRIEGSNNKDFRNLDILHTISSSPKRKITKVKLATGKKYRYLRYVGADSTYCNIGEVEVYADGSDGNIAPGCPTFGTPGDKSGKGTHEYPNVFDGDLYTSFDYKDPSGGWSAVDLGKPKIITSIAYSPRNRDNYIRSGDLYELFFWSDSGNIWISLGKQMADSDELVYNVPQGALLFLKNHTRGVNECVFEYDADRMLQIFH